MFTSTIVEGRSALYDNPKIKKGTFFASATPVLVGKHPLRDIVVDVFVSIKYVSDELWDLLSQNQQGGLPPDSI